MTNKLKFEPLVFFGIAFIFLLYIWSIPVFLTQDGPSHLYNSKILLDIITSNNSEFYFQYLDVNSQFSPNWFSNIFLSFLLYFLSPIVVEKLFISMLILAIPISFRYVIKSINYKSIFLSSSVFVLSNSYFLIYGFYNFQWSLVFFLFFIGYYIKNKNTLSVKNTILLSLICILIFFTHPVAYIQIAILLVIEVARELFCFFKNKIGSKKETVRKIIQLVSVLLIPGILFISFFRNSQSSSQNIFNNNFSLDHLKNLFNLSNLFVFNEVEQCFLFFFSLLVLLFFGIFCYKQKMKIKGFPLTLIGLLLINLFIYFFVSANLAGGSYLLPRITVYFYLILLLISANHFFSNLAKKIYLVASVIICLSFLIIRYPYQKKIGELAESYLELAENIKENSTVLPVGFSNKGEFNSEVLSPRIRLFKHIGCYTGVSKQVLSFENYEANTTYFPLLWKDFINPYKHLSYKFELGIEFNPPLVDITSFNKRKNCQVDYVMLFGDPSRFSDSEEMKFLNKQLNENYQIIKSSTDNLVKLYIKSTLMKSDAISN